SSYEKLRKKIINKKQIDTMLHLGARAFEEISGEVVQSTAFVLRNRVLEENKGLYLRLVDYNTAQVKDEKILKAVTNPNDLHRYTFDQSMFKQIPGSLISYWISKKYTKIFTENSTLKEYADTCTGMQTGNNPKYIRNWFEISSCQTDIFTSEGKWKKYNTGGENRKWYGNHNHVVYWKNNGESIRSEKSSVIRNEKFYYLEGISWKRIGSNAIYLRYMPQGFIFDQSGDAMFIKERKNLEYILGFVNSKVTLKSFEIYSPTLTLTAGNMDKLPIIKKDNYKDKINKYVKENIFCSKNDWDSFETSWDFKKHPLLNYPSSTIKSSFSDWQNHAENQFNQLKSNEEELNRIFIEIYGLEDELTPEVEDKD